MRLKTILIIQIFVFVVIGTGWVKNIIKLSDCDFKFPYKAEVVYTAGLIPPVGAVTGWLNLGK